jgi:hypothetical protein
MNCWLERSLKLRSETCQTKPINPVHLPAVRAKGALKATAEVCMMAEI